MKDLVLKYLKENTETFLSGEYLSNVFGVSRAAIWKVVKQLEGEGYGIESKTKLGYKLVSSPDVLNSFEVKSGLNTKRLARNVHYFKEIDSTNEYAKTLAKKSFQDGDMVISEMQSQGRGRFNREWVSRTGKGIYMSILLKPEVSYERITQLTIFVSLAICEALEDYLNTEFEIKWPNDILLNGKKICGILTEISGEVDKINYVIVGVGININLQKDDFSDNLQSKASSLRIETGSELDRKEVLQKVLTLLDKYYDDYLKGVEMPLILQKYKSKLNLMKKEVEIKVHNTKPVKGQVVDIGNNGALIVKMKDGIVKEFLSGEVSFNTELTPPNSPASIDCEPQRAAKTSMDSTNIQ